MSTVTFDTLKFVESLTASGIPEGQARAISRAFAEAHQESDLATKGDLKTELLLLEQRMALKLGSMMIVAVGVVATLVAIF